MALFFYLVDCANHTPPAALQAVGYVHVKAKTDGSQLVAIAEENVNDPACTKRTQAQAQTILDGWIDAENASPPIDPVTEQPMIQSRILLNNFLEE